MGVRGASLVAGRWGGFVAPLALALFVFFVISPCHQPAQAQVGLGRAVVSITVRVTNQSTGGNLEQVKAELLRFPDEIVLQIFTDSSGRGVFPNMAPGTYIVRVSAPGFRTARLEIDTQRGMTIYQASIQMEPDEPTPNTPGGKISARQLAIPEPARQEFQQAVESLQQKKDPKEAVGHLEKAIAAFPGYYEAYLMLGMAELQTNSVNEAQASLRKAIELNPEFLQPYHPLALLLIRQKQYDEAERVLQQAIKLDPEGWQWPYELGRAYGNRGIWGKAMDFSARALAKPGVPAKAHLLMADIYNNQGSKDKAIAEFETFLKLDPQSPYVPRVQQVILQLRKPK